MSDDEKPMSEIGETEILNGLNFFVMDILQPSISDSNWNHETIEKALRWGLFCEKVFQTHATFHIGQKFISMRGDKSLSQSQFLKARKILISNFFINQLISRDVLSTVEELATNMLGSDCLENIKESSEEKKKNYNDAMPILQGNELRMVYNKFKLRLLIEMAYQLQDAPQSECSKPLSQFKFSSDNISAILELYSELSGSDADQVLFYLGDLINKEFDKDSINVLSVLVSLLPTSLNLLCERLVGFQIKLLNLMRYFGTHYEDYNNIYVTLKKLCLMMVSSRDLTLTTKCMIEKIQCPGESSFWIKLFMDALS